MDVLAHDPLAAGKAVLGHQAVEDPLGSVALLARAVSSAVSQASMSAMTGSSTGRGFGCAQAVPPRLGLVAGQHLADGAATMVQLTGNRPHAFVLDEVGPAYGFALLHRQHPVLPLAGAP